VKQNSTVAVWGLGAVGLSVLMGAKEAGAIEIVGIDINPSKFKIAHEFGATQCLNPLDFPDKPFQQTLVEKFNGGFDYTFEAIGLSETIKCAFESTRGAWGVAVVIGVADNSKEVAIKPFHLIGGKTWKGTAFGGL
jgi:S-(hydroxymethyl)glutathione dehydrogenase/alcohol dehydrogenase